MESVWSDIIDRTKNFVKRPERFLNSDDPSDYEKSKILLKVLYDGAKLSTSESDSFQASVKTLPELVIEDFDEEQVWAGVELQNNYVFDECQEKLSRLMNLPQSLLKFRPSASKIEGQEEIDEESEDELPMPEIAQEDSESEDEDGDADMDVESDEENEGEDEDNDSIFDDPDFQHMSDSDLDDKLPLFDRTDSEDSDLDDEDDKAEEEKLSKAEQKERELESKTSDYMANAMKALKSATTNVVEDEFFKLDEMEKFLDAEDAKAMKDQDVDQKDDGIDYFEDDTGDDEDESAAMMYKDFFEPVQGDKSDVKDLLQSDEDNSDREMGEVKSTHELRTMRLQKKIKEMEKEAVEAGPWQMKGEVAALERPENALLEEHLDYETVSKQAPIITEEVSKRLEDIIKQRIKDQAWDDVERKVKPVENPYEYKKKLILDQEKSKLSLAQVYEEEYLKQKGDMESSNNAPGMLDEEDEDKPETVDEIKSRMKELFAKLDTLTHYHYTPQALNPEVKVVRNLPTISMEEVAPVAMSDATLLAPQEIVDKKRGEEVGSSERTDTDKKRDLRLKKTKQRKIKKAKERKEKLVQKLNPSLGTKYSKKAALKAIEQAEKEGKVKTIKEKNKSVKSSKAFFDKMQNEVQSIVSDIKADKMKKKKNSGHINAAALKL